MIHPSPDFIKRIAVQAGNATLKYFGNAKVKYTKSNQSDVVTEADLHSNKIIVEAIKKQFPSHAILSEEGIPETMNHDHLWIIDPLDGTFNFSHHTPLYGVMIAYVHKGVPEMCTIYLPYFRELYFAKRNHGAFLNGKRIHCATTDKLLHSYGTSGTKIGGDRGKLQYDHLMRAVGKERVWLSGLGSIAVSSAYTACGRRDWYTSLGGGIWDNVPAVLLLQEAGCKITALDGKPWTITDKGFVAANPILFPKILALCKGMK